MSSARKRSAIAKANREADKARQMLVLVEFQYSTLEIMAKAVAQALDQARDVLRTFVADIDAVGGESHLKEHWPDLLPTYHAAQKLLPPHKEAT